MKVKFGEGNHGATILLYKMKWQRRQFFIFDDLEINVKTLVHLNRNGKLFHPNKHTQTCHICQQLFFI